MAEGYRLLFKEEELILLAQKAIWFPVHQTLLVSDTHLGKGSHFRKAGIAIPKALEQEDLALLSDLIAQYKPNCLIFLGDLFHSDMNNDWTWFILWREMHRKVEMVLVKGNHDILPLRFYEKSNIRVCNDLLLGEFKLMHDHQKIPEENYIISGHVHPGVKLKGKARQGITLPCFYFGENYAILPAFGKFTGKALLKPRTNDKIFAVAGNKIISLT